MYLRGQRAGGVDKHHLARLRGGGDGFRHTMRRENDRAIIGAFFEFFDEHRPLVAQTIDHEFIVHDFMAHIDRCAPFL